MALLYKTKADDTSQTSVGFNVLVGSKSFPIGSPALKWGFGSVTFTDTHFSCEINVSTPTPESVSCETGDLRSR